MKLHFNSCKLIMNTSLTATRRLRLTQNHLLASQRFLSYDSIDQGTKYTADYLKYLVENEPNKSTIKSFMHDVPLDLNVNDKTVNMVVEVPRWSNAKFEINTKLEANPITQDVKKNQVRFIKNLFPFHGYIHNYGALPRTWEDLTCSNGALNLFGDNDPLDVVEIGSKIIASGSIIRVKVLGALALIDDGELDWKVVAIKETDPLASKLNDINDVRIHCPNVLELTREWFRNYKIPDGKGENKFAFNGEYKNQQETIELIKETHKAWEKLIYDKLEVDDKSKLPCIVNTTITDSPGYKQGFNEKQLLVNPSKPGQIPDQVHGLYYHLKKIHIE